ncbi:DNA mismatch repair mitochondrial isoform X1, partial [Micractinium conductrix]
VLGLQAALGVESGSDEGDGEDAVRNGSAAPAPSRRAAFSSRSGRPPLYTYFRGVKKQHPKSVVLVRVGEFYEAVGIDAVLLNLRRTVADLVAAGLSVVVCEETPEGYSYGSMRTKQKQRFVAAVVTPANPHLLHGLVDEDADCQSMPAPPLLALVPQVGGYTVLEVSVDLATVSVMEGLTEDAVYARLHEDPLEGLLTRIRSMLGLSASEHFTVIRASARDRPRPLYHSTALNLGLHKARGQPCLLDYLLPPASPLPARRWLRRLLLLPPPPATAVAIHRACAILAGITEPVPAFPLVPAASVVLKLRAHEANDIFFSRAGGAVNEMPLKGKVKESVLASQMEQASVELARNRVQRELEAAYVPVLQAWQAEMARPITEKDRKELAKERPLLQYDSANNALWLRVKGRKNAAITQAAAHLVHPHDRNGKLDGSFHATHGLQSALDDYRRACHEAAAAVRHHLRQLARDLQVLQTQLVCAAGICVAAAALTGHTREALRRGWCLPTQGFDGTGPPPEPAEGAQPDVFAIDSMWPYWLDGWEHSTVHNSLDLQGMALLTGPNMAGKSTILRSVCAVALLGACGLYAPAHTAAVPYFDAFMLRNFSSDSPLEGRSAFAVEMTEMRYVLDDVTPRSLVLVDELGKGTEVRAGAALAGALMERLDGSRCRGLFATHLHSLLDLQLQLPNTERLMMEVESVPVEQLGALWEEALGGSGADGNGAHSGSSGNGACSASCGSSSGSSDDGSPATVRRPTWRIVPGTSTESLALEVARKCRLPDEVVARAAQLYSQLLPVQARTPPAAAASARPAAAAHEGAVAGTAAAAARHGSAGAGAVAAATAARNRWTLEAAATALQEVAQDTIETAAGGQGGPVQQLQVVRPRQEPGPASEGTACVYVLRRADGFFYAGSTGRMLGRLKEHRKRAAHGPALELAYISLGPAKDWTALANTVESALIRELQSRGFPFESATDARRRHVAGASGTSGSAGSNAGAGGGEGEKSDGSSQREQLR